MKVQKEEELKRRTIETPTRYEVEVQVKQAKKAKQAKRQGRRDMFFGSEIPENHTNWNA